MIILLLSRHIYYVHYLQSSMSLEKIRCPSQLFRPIVSYIMYKQKWTKNKIIKNIAQDDFINVRRSHLIERFYTTYIIYELLKFFSQKQVERWRGIL